MNTDADSRKVPQPTEAGRGQDGLRGRQETLGGAAPSGWAVHTSTGSAGRGGKTHGLRRTRQNGLRIVGRLGRQELLQSPALSQRLPHLPGVLGREVRHHQIRVGAHLPGRAHCRQR